MGAVLALVEPDRLLLAIQALDALDGSPVIVALTCGTTVKGAHDDIAAVLGFSDVTNLRRAFKRWTGKTLSAYRHAMLPNDAPGRQVQSDS